MKYGTHTKLVEEIVDFVKTGKILFLSSNTINHAYIIDSLQQAKFYAWDKTYGKDEYSWSDIREKEMSKVKKIAYEMESFEDIRVNLSKLLKLFTIYIRKKLDEHYNDLLDDIIGDLYNCAFNRAVNGKIDNFYEKIYEAYFSGGWVCGWHGEYPKGELSVFFPRE
nr:hypothetical protein [uncultured Desulfobacter sp.]